MRPQARQAAQPRALISAGSVKPWESLRMKEAFTVPKDLADRTGPMGKSRSLSWRLGVSTLVIVLPLAVFALIMVGWITHERARRAAKTVDWRRLRAR